MRDGDVGPNKPSLGKGSQNSFQILRRNIHRDIVSGETIGFEPMPVQLGGLRMRNRVPNNSGQRNSGFTSLINHPFNGQKIQQLQQGHTQDVKIVPVNAGEQAHAFFF